MPIAPKNVLESYFETGDEPTAAQFSTLIRSMVNIIDDRYLLGLRTYDTLKSYLVGDTAIYNNALYECISNTTGAFNPLQWTVITQLGSVVYAGTWDTQANSPALASSVGVKGTYYVVINASPNPSDNTMLNGIDNWGTSDWAIFNGSSWEKVDNSQAPADASNVRLTPFPGVIATNVQDGMQEIVSDFNTLLQDKMSVVNSAGDGNIGIFLSGTMVDSNKQVTDFLPNTTIAADIPFTPPSPLTGANVQAGIVDLKNYTDSSLGTKANLVSPAPTPNDFASLTITGDIADSGFNSASFLSSSTVAANIPSSAFTGVSATNVQNALQEIYGNLNVAKADKVSSATPGNFSSLIAGGNIADSGFNPSSFLPGTTVAVNIPSSPFTGVGATNVQNALQEVFGNLNVAKADKVNGATVGNFPSLIAGGNIADSGFRPSSFLPATTIAVNIPSSPFTGISATNVQNALQEVFGNLNVAKADKVNGATVGNFSSLIAGGNIADSGFRPSSFLSSSTNASNIPFTPTTTIVSTNVQAAIVELNNKLRKVVIPFPLTGAFATTSSTFVSVPLEIIVPNLTEVYPLATSISAKLYVDYLTQNGGIPSGANASGEMALGEWTLAAGATVVAGSTTALPATLNAWNKITTASFTLDAGRTYRVLIRRITGSGIPQPQMQIEAATLVLTYS